MSTEAVATHRPLVIEFLDEYVSIKGRREFFLSRQSNEIRYKLLKEWCNKNKEIGEQLFKYVATNTNDNKELMLSESISSRNHAKGLEAFKYLVEMIAPELPEMEGLTLKQHDSQPNCYHVSITYND